MDEDGMMADSIDRMREEQARTTDQLKRIADLLEKAAAKWGIK